ncbi:MULTISPECIES: murein transglycosylase A [unclassified Anabaena]|uniref:murein transglycosylase A n=1 Tax=unclassified Anabaena TaxID=2619674 RepID=UPI002B1F3A10|nr:murein transglycosylase A [Anabaena sp. UHCC 0399]MEA5566183.1 murein transglycosylase A [Anabaena sp. UHCC 0399]
MMRKTLALLSLSLGIAFINPIAVAQVIINVPPPNSSTSELQPPVKPSTPEIEQPLKLVQVGNCTAQNTCLGWDEQILGSRGKPGDRQALLASIDHSLRYLNTNTAQRIYQNYPVQGITLDRVRRSLLRFRQLVVNSKSTAQLQAAVQREFAFYQSVGNDGQGSVKFTSYYQPVYNASRVRTSAYKYPLYRLPPNFDKWPTPHPTRLQLEGKNGLLGNKSKLRGLELLWFRDRLDAYMIHIQGSAQIQLADGTRTSIGYAGATDYPWTSIGGELAKDGKLPLSGLTMPKMISFFKAQPQELNNYLPRWERFVFFQEAKGRPATGSINVPVTAERSIATDKSLMPPGALALVQTSLPYPATGGKLEYRRVSRFVLDQDTGSAIKGPGRVDYFMGTGKLAGDRAGVTGGNGSLYYLLLK